MYFNRCNDFKPREEKVCTIPPPPQSFFAVISEYMGGGEKLQGTFCIGNNEISS
jgi:hypothetical protein